jgi:hypothetical protein
VSSDSVVWGEWSSIGGGDFVAFSFVAALGIALVAAGLLLVLLRFRQRPDEQSTWAWKSFSVTFRSPGLPMIALGLIALGIVAPRWATPKAASATPFRATPTASPTGAPPTGSVTASPSESSLHPTSRALPHAASIPHSDKAGADGDRAPSSSAPSSPSPKSSPTPSESPTPTPAPTPTPLPSTPPPLPNGSSGNVSEERFVTLTPGNGSVDIDWWRQYKDASGDLRIDQDGLYTQKGAALTLIEDTPDATYARCSQVQAWGSRVHFSQLHAGSQLCARSYMGRYASMKVTSMPSETVAGEFVFYGRVWFGP